MNEMMYTDKDREADFEFFVTHYDELFLQYGRCFLAIRNGAVLGFFKTAKGAFDALAAEYPRGTYILQECTGKTSAYQTRIAGVKVYA